MVTNSKEYQKKYYKKNKKKIYESHRKWDKKNKKKIRKSKNEWSKRNPKTRTKIQKEYAKRNPNKIKAQNLANYHIPLKDHCQICGLKERLERHHQDYSKPYEVLTVCKECHTKIHGGNLKLQK